MVPRGCKPISSRQLVLLLSPLLGAETQTEIKTSFNFRWLLHRIQKYGEVPPWDGGSKYQRVSRITEQCG